MASVPDRPPSPARPLVLIFGMPLVLAALYYTWLGVQVGRMGYSWREMDWNGDGRTTVREYFETAEVLERPFNEGGQPCTELYNARTGKQMKLRCP